MACCGKPVSPHDEYAKEPGIMEKRSCRDVFFLILFVAFWAGMFYVGAQGIKRGNPTRLIYGVDGDGNICGSNNLPNNESLRGRAQDFTNKRYLYFLPNVNGGGLVEICVSACPNKTHLYPDSVDEIYCPYNVTPAVDHLFPNGSCLGEYASTPVIHRCIPTFVSNVTQLMSNIVNSTNLEIADDLFLKVFGQLVSAWKWIAISGAVALLMSFVWLILLRWFAGVLVWVTILGALAAVAALAALVYRQANSVSNAYGDIPVYLRLVSDVELQKSLRYVFYGLVAIEAILVLVILFMRNRIKTGVGIIKEASRAVVAIPTIMLIPVITAIMLIPAAVYWVWVGAYLGTSGTPYFDDAGNFVKYKANTTYRYMMLYHLFGGFWTLNFLHAVGECSIAGAVASWYWLIDKKNLTRAPVAKAFWRTFRYHMGSLLLGSLILSIVQFIRFLLSQLERKIKGKEDRLTKCLFKFLQCLLIIFEKFIKFLNKNAYIMIAIYGYSFCEGARKGFGLIASNVLRVVALNCVTGFLLFLGKLFVCVSTTLIFFLKLKDDASVSNYIFPLIAIAVLAYAISVFFFGVVDMAVDTVLLCFCEDCERNDGSAEKPYYMSDSLKSLVDTKHGSCCCMC